MVGTYGDDNWTVTVQGTSKNVEMINLELNDLQQNVGRGPLVIDMDDNAQNWTETTTMSVVPGDLEYCLPSRPLMTVTLTYLRVRSVA